MNRNVRFPLTVMTASKLFFLASVCMNIGGYYVLNMVNISLAHGETFLNDFYLVFMKGVTTFLSNPNALYANNGGTWLTASAYRNLPALVLYHFPFSRLGSAGNLDLIACSLFIVYFNLGTCYLVFKIATRVQTRAASTNNIFSNPFIVAGAYMLVAWHYFEYHHAHTQAITAFLVVLGMYFMLEDKEHLCFACWSAATIFKLPIVVWIAYLIIKPPFTRFLKNVVYCILPQVPNIIMFIAWPTLLVDFIPSNIAFSLENAETFYIVSGTISRELARLLGIPITGVSLFFFASFVPLTFLVLFRTRMHEFDKIMLVALSTITVLPDFQTAHALYVLVPYLFWLGSRSFLHFKWKLICFVPLLFASPWFLLITLNQVLVRSFPTLSLLFFLPLVAMIWTGLRDHANHSAPIVLEPPPSVARTGVLDEN